MGGEGSREGASFRTERPAAHALVYFSPDGAAQSAFLQADLAGASCTLRGHRWSCQMMTQKVRPVTSMTHSRPNRNRHRRSEMLRTGRIPLSPAPVRSSPALTRDGRLPDSLQERQLCRKAWRPVQTISCFRLGTFAPFLYIHLHKTCVLNRLSHRCIYFPYIHQETIL